jgi:CrcB protein
MLIVGAGSFVGGALRYYLSTLVKGCCNGNFPWGTLTVNLVGCFVFGVLFALFHRWGAEHSIWCLLFTTGVCGGFTTYSTFANEGVQLLQTGNVMGFAGYLAASLIVGLACIALGYWVAG